MVLDRFNWGIIGPGKIARKFAKAVDVIDDATIYSVASRNKERSIDFAKEYNAAKPYNSYEELVKDPNVDAVYIATPHRFHFDHALLALKSFKPVLCEKPLTVNSKQAEILIETAVKNNVFLMEALWTRYLPIYKVIKNWLDDRQIGDVKLMTSTYGFAFDRDLTDRKFNHELAGGALLDLGIYPIAISQWITNANPQKISANAFIGETNVDEMTAANLYYKNGVIAQLSCNFLSQNENDFVIYGTNGKIRIHNNFWGATEATIYSNGNETKVSRPFKENGFEYQIEEAIKCIKNGKIESDNMTHQNSLENIKLMDNIRKEIGLNYSFE